MSRLSDLLRQVGERNAELAAEIAAEVKALESRRAFGLNFERHTPESVELPGRPVRKGDKVRFLPERGAAANSVDTGLWQVIGFRNVEEGRVALLARLRADGDEPETAERLVDDLVVVAEFRDPIYPGLQSTGKVERGGDKPYHTVINAENFHALQALLYTHAGKIDAIYIDPPYNTGAKDWKYNNDYVEADDNYRHSKWLAMMERRLLVAKKLLNRADSVLIVTIDEKEYLRVGLLLEQLFPEARIQMISSSINPKGSARGKEFYRVDEYIYFVTFGRAVVQDHLVPGLCITKENEAERANASSNLPPVRWASLLRSGRGAQREDSHLKFYPIYVDVRAGQILGCGDPLSLGEAPSYSHEDKNVRVCWPIRQNGSEGRWQLNVVSFRQMLEEGYLKVGNMTESKITFYYLMEGQQAKLKAGELVVTGNDRFGGIIVEYANAASISG